MTIVPNCLVDEMVGNETSILLLPGAAVPNRGIAVPFHHRIKRKPEFTVKEIFLLSYESHCNLNSQML